MLFVYPKTLVYTTIFGNRKIDFQGQPRRDFLKPPFLIPNCDYICFTDRDDLNDEIWQIHKVDKGNSLSMYLKGIDVEQISRRQSRIYKMLGHTFYPNYNYYLYIDCNIEITKDFMPFMIQELSDVDICFSKHPSVNCVYKEIDGIEFLWKEHEICKSLRLKLISEGFPKNNGVVAGGRFFYKNEPNSKKFLSFWHDTYCLYSQRDQATANYCLWKLKTKFKYITYPVLSKYGIHLP